MRTLYLLVVINIGFALTSCATIEQPANNQKYKETVPSVPLQPPLCPPVHKSPLAVTFYTNGVPSRPYKILGEESISKYNLGGNKRQEAVIRDGMREIAAAMGGDAVINLKHNSKSITGTVVAYQKDKNIAS